MEKLTCKYNPTCYWSTGVLLTSCGASECMEHSLPRNANSQTHNTVAGTEDSFPAKLLCSTIKLMPDLNPIVE